jgi:glycosyltransferase involved in cell wall biosynthesis
MRYLGFAVDRIAEGYDTLSVDRIREQAPGPPAPDGPAHAERDFVIVARLVAKKNIALALAAFAQFRAETGSTRTLRILGSGDCEPSLRALADELDVADATVFEGFVQTARVSEALSRALCLILPSSEEQFGLVVIEAMAMGVPALVSSNAGAVEKMIDNGVNGWIIDPSSPRALVAAMALLNCDAAAWMRMATAAREDSIRGDVPSFVEGVMALSEPGRG